MSDADALHRLGLDLRLVFTGRSIGMDSMLLHFSGMIDRMPQWFHVGLLVNHRNAHADRVTHYVTYPTRILGFPHRVGSEGMASVAQDNSIGDSRPSPVLPRNPPVTAVR